MRYYPLDLMINDMTQFVISVFMDQTCFLTIVFKKNSNVLSCTLKRVIYIEETYSIPFSYQLHIDMRYTCD